MSADLTPATPVDLTPANFGLKKSLWRQLLAQRNKTVDSVGRDKFYRENNLPFVTKYSKLHPLQNFSYTFNSWGLRDNVDYDQYYKKPVILCILVNSSTWFNAFCPVVASKTRIVSLGKV